jgi:outer membrane protein assembly factor BamB
MLFYIIKARRFFLQPGQRYFIFSFVTLILLVVSLGSGLAAGDDTLMFLRTTDRINVTSGSVPDDVEVAWRAELEGETYTTPVVWDGKVYVGSGWMNDDGNNDILYCHDADSGEELWRFECAKGSQSDFGLCSTPFIEDGLIYFGASDFLVYCMEAKTGEVVWSRDLEVLPDTKVKYGAIASPIVTDDKVIFGADLSYWNYDESYPHRPNLFCLDKSDGSEIWNYTNDEYVSVAHYSSPAVSGDKVIIGTYEVSNVGQGQFVCLDLDDGSEIWTYSIPMPTMVTPTIKDGIAYIGTGDFMKNNLGQYSVYAVDMDSTGDLAWMDEEWSFTSTDQFLSSAVPHNDNVYVADMGGDVHCINTDAGIDKIANAHWTFNTGTEIWATPTIVGDRLVVGNFAGDLYCLDISGDSPTEVWQIHPSDKDIHKIYSTATFWEEKIYVTTTNDLATDDHGYLFCIGESTSGPLQVDEILALTEGVLDYETGDDRDQFSFSVLYTHSDGIPPDYISLYVDGNQEPMSPVTSGPASDFDEDYSNGERFMVTIMLDAGEHTYYFEASDGSEEDATSPVTFTVTEHIEPVDDDVDPPPDNDPPVTTDDDDDTGSEKSSSFMSDNLAYVLGGLAVILVLVLIFALVKKRRRGKVLDGEETEMPEASQLVVEAVVVEEYDD